MHWAVGGLLWVGLVSDPEPIVVLPQFEDGIPVPVQRSLAETAGATLAEHGVSPRVAEQTACEGVSCAEALGGERGVSVSISRVARDYTVTARVLESDGAVVREEVRVCKICRHDELATTVGEAVDAAAQVFDAPATGTLSVVSRPSGASVRVDGEVVGTTPLQVELPVGSHEVTVEAKGRKDATQLAEITEGEIARHAFSLGISPRTEERIGWGGVALGAVAVVSGVVLLAIDDPPDRRTLGAGVGVLVGGVVIGGGGGVLVWHGRKQSGNAPAPSASLGLGGVRARF